MGVEAILVASIGLVALLLLVAVFQLSDKPGEPPASRAFQASFVLHALFLGGLIGALATPDSLFWEAFTNSCLAGLNAATLLGVSWRSGLAFPTKIFLPASIGFVIFDTAIPGIAGLRFGMLFVAAATGLCALRVMRRPRGANRADAVLAAVFTGWSGLNLLIFGLSWFPASGIRTEEEALTALLAPAAALFAGYGVFLVVSYMLDSQQDLKQLAEQDQLTGLGNRRFLETQGPRFIQTAAHNGRQVSLIEIDVDHFKQINDRHGHQCGDRVLQHIATILRGAAPPASLVARIGGEEFVILLAHAKGDEAGALAEAIRAGIESADIRHADKAIACTASLGVATAEAGETLEALLQRADALLYQAKRAGRNKCLTSSGS